MPFTVGVTITSGFGGDEEEDDASTSKLVKEIVPLLKTDVVLTAGAEVALKALMGLASKSAIAIAVSFSFYFVCI